MSLTVQQLLNDAKRLTARLRDHDDAANRVVSHAQDAYKSVTEMRTYQEDIETLNAIAHNRPRAQLVLGIQQENRHIRQLQQENKELRATLEEHQNAIELIMSKYRQHMMCLVNSTKLDKNALRNQKAKLLQERVDKICEMANVMTHSIQIDEEGQAQEQEVMSRLITENKGLREMLEISFKNGSYSDPLVGPKVVSQECQTDLPEASMANLSLGQKFPNNCDLTNDNTIDNDVGLSVIPSLASGQECKHCRTVNEVNSNSSENSNSNNSSVVSNRPVSVSSISSEESSESSTSEDDEVTFNTIKRNLNKTSSSSDPPLLSGDNNSCVNPSDNSNKVIVNNGIKTKTNGEAASSEQGAANLDGKG